MSTIEEFRNNSSYTL